MKLFAQHGAQEGEKIEEGFTRGLLDGVIYSPRDVSLETLRSKLAFLAKEYPSSERLVDPQYYAIFLNGTEEARLGYLLEDYGVYFQARRRGQLEREKQIPVSYTHLVRRREMLHHRVMFEIQQDFRTDTFRDISGDQHEMQLALVVTQLLAADEQDPRPQNEWKQAFHRSGWCWLVHRGNSKICRADIPVCWFWRLSSRQCG